MVRWSTPYRYFMRGCGASGEDNPARARFCLACCQPLDGEPEVVPELRRSVSTIFVDLVGSTVLGESLDAEALRYVTGPYFDTMRTAVERHEGTVEKFIGDAVVALFGVPRVREDDALRTPAPGLTCWPGATRRSPRFSGRGLLRTSRW
jgi:class 3 adenylate cyclase